MKAITFKFGTWQRTSKGGRVYYHHNGHFTSAKKFDAANARRKHKKQPPAESPKKEQAKEQEFSLCSLRDRQAFYDRVIEDRKALRPKLTEEEISALRVDIDIGLTRQKPRKTKKGTMSQQGYRRFRDLRKLRNFLGLNVKYDNSPSFGPKRGVCRYKKTAYLLVTKMRGERETGRRIFRRYSYNP